MDIAPVRHASRFPRLARAVALIGHPLLLAGALAAWWALGGDDLAMLGALGGMLLTMTLERLIPAAPHWRLGVAASLRLLALYALGLLLSGGLIAAYGAVLSPALAGVRAQVGGALWLASWPPLAQALLLYFAADFVYYWIHRAIHRWPALWRLSGHGFHHAFQNLHAVNAGASHPFELVPLALPLVLVAALCGPSDQAVNVAGVLLLGNAMLAHANVHMDTPVFSLFFTSSDQHRRHHSAVFEDSNTNYACNAILWDRVFRTYSRGAVAQTGIGPTQPPLWRMFLLPFVEPRDVDTVATRGRAQG